MKLPPVASQRARDAATLLPIVGFFLFMPPVVTLFVADAAVAGVPLIVAYILGVWLALIACAAWLGRRLMPRPDNETAGSGRGPGLLDRETAPPGSENAGDRDR